jgi:hypothetical protein
MFGFKYVVFHGFFPHLNLVRCSTSSWPEQVVYGWYYSIFTLPRSIIARPNPFVKKSA